MVWPNSSPAGRLARAVVRSCLQIADGSITRSIEGSKLTPPVAATQIGKFLKEHHDGLLASTEFKKLKQFFQGQQQRQYFLLAPLIEGGNSVSMDLDAIHTAALLLARGGTQLAVASASQAMAALKVQQSRTSFSGVSQYICETSLPMPVCSLPLCETSSVQCSARCLTNDHVLNSCIICLASRKNSCIGCCTMQVTDAAAELLSMLSSLTPSRHMVAMGDVYLRAGLEQINKRFESQPVKLELIGANLGVAKIRGDFPRSLKKFFEQSDSLRYFSVSDSGSPMVSVTMRIGNLVSDYLKRAQPQASNSKGLISQVAPASTLKGSEAGCLSVNSLPAGKKGVSATLTPFQLGNWHLD